MIDLFNTYNDNSFFPLETKEEKQFDEKQFKVYNASAGSGKTYTLVKEYLKIVLKTTNIFKFQQILAITFTNKAAAEMKIRILESLRKFSESDLENLNDSLFLDICKELNLEKEVVQRRAINVLKSILNNYAGFGITTIDSFTYKLIKSFAFDLGLSQNFEVEMDATSLLNKAVDVLISKIGTNKELTKTLLNFSIQKTRENRSWDITVDLQEIATLLLNENDYLHIEKIKNRPISDFIALKNSIYRQQEKIEDLFQEIAAIALELIEVADLKPKDFIYDDLPNHFKKLRDLKLEDLKFTGRLEKNIIANHFYTNSKPISTQTSIDYIKDELKYHYQQSKAVYNEHYKTYLLNKLIVRSLVPLATLHAINTTLNEIKEEQNICLNYEFNQLISNHLKEQPAAFIYEKIGEKYQHYFIDEMQDTSTMQWQNLIPLINNALNSQNTKGEKGSLLLVGDAKQAIYRWRGGKAEQFIDLTTTENPFLVEKHLENLPKNYRSYSKVIQFNNDFFSYLAKFLKREVYQKLYTIGNEQEENDNKGGYVEIQFIEEGLSAAEKDEVYPDKILEIINNLEGKFHKNEICILTRTKKQGITIATFLTANNIAVISSETLLIKSSKTVNFIINWINLVLQPSDKDVRFDVLVFLHNHYNITIKKHQFISEYIDLDINLFYENLEVLDIYFNPSKFLSLSFYESIEHLIRTFNLMPKSDAYVQFFLDVILDYSFKQNEGLHAFLDFWEEKKDKLSIVVPDGRDAVRIMTIHKAKGLEFPVVIYPYDLNIYYQINPKVWYEPLDKTQYNNFESSLVSYSKSLQEIKGVGENLYKKREEELELDSFNLLYVALTRAEEQLYIISEHKNLKDEPKFYAHFFELFLRSVGKWNDQDVYKFGSNIRVSEKKKPKLISETQTEFITSDWKNHNITIVANSAFEPNFEDARKYGNIIHEILAKIITKEDITFTIQQFINKGIVPIDRKEEVTTLIQKIVNNDILKPYFLQENTVINEREILTEDGTFLIPDRLVFNKNNVVIIDYKTGKKEKKHQFQINTYADLLTKMNYTVTKKLLVYINQDVTVLEV